MKKSHRSNFDKTSISNCREKNLVFSLKKFIEIGSVVFELIRFEKCPIFNIERVQIFRKYGRILSVREQRGSYAGPLFKLPVDKVTPEKFQGARTGTRTHVAELRGKDATN